MTRSNSRPLALSQSSNFATSVSTRVPAGEFGHALVGIDPQHPAAGRLELPDCDPGAGAHVEDAGSRAGGDDPVHHGVGVARPDPVVASGVRAERLRYLPGLMRLLFRHTRAPEV